MADSKRQPERLDALCDLLLEGFHVAAQPLTMIQAALSADCTVGMPDEELRELTLTCSREADRLTRTFRVLKRLVQAHRYAPVLRSVELAELVKSRIAETASNGEGEAVPVRVEVSSGLAEVTADGDATAEMLQTLIEVLAAYCDSGDMLVVRGEEKSGQVQLSIASGRSFLTRAPGEFKVAMPLVSARMELQKGTASWRMSPLAVELNFATAMSAE